MGKISWTDRVKNEEVLVLLRAKEERKIIHKTYTNCFLNTFLKGR